MELEFLGDYERANSTLSGRGKIGLKNLTSDVNGLDMGLSIGYPDIQHQNSFRSKSNSKKMRRPLLCNKFNLIFIAKTSCWDVEQRLDYYNHR